MVAAGRRWLGKQRGRGILEENSQAVKEIDGFVYRVPVPGMTPGGAPGAGALESVDEGPGGAVVGFGRGGVLPAEPSFSGAVGAVGAAVTAVASSPARSTV